MPDVGVVDIAFKAGLYGECAADLTVPGGANRAGDTCVEGLLEDTGVAGASHSVEERVGGAGRHSNVDGGTLSTDQVEPGIADAADAVVVGVGRAGGDLKTVSSYILGTIDTDTSLETSIVSFVVVAVGLEVAFLAVAVVVPVVADIALTGNSVEGLIGAAWSAGIEDPVVAIVAVALSVLEVAVETTVLVAAALSVDDSVARVADTALRLDVVAAEQRTDDGGGTLSVDDCQSVGTYALAVDVGGVDGAGRVAEAILLDVSRFAQTTITVAVVVLSRVAVGADSSDFDVPRRADAGLSGGREYLVDALARHTAAGLTVLVVCLLGLALAADPLDDVVSSSTVALA